MQAEDKPQELYKDIGIVENLKSDRAPEFYGQESSHLKLAKGKRINLNYADPELSNEIYNGEIAIREIKKRWNHKMVSKNFPSRVLEFGIKHSTKVMHLTPSEKINGRTPIASVMG